LKASTYRHRSRGKREVLWRVDTTAQRSAFRATPLMDVCRESREVVLNSYEPAFGSVLYSKKSIYLDWKRDCIFFCDTDALLLCFIPHDPATTKTWPTSPTVSEEDALRWRTRARHLVVNGGHFGNPQVWHMRDFRTLKTLVLRDNCEFRFWGDYKDAECSNVGLVNLLQKIWKPRMNLDTAAMPTITFLPFEELEEQAKVEEVYFLNSDNVKDKLTLFSQPVFRNDEKMALNVLRPLQHFSSPPVLPRSRGSCVPSLPANGKMIPWEAYLGSIALAA
jgi:hypothetical protein